MNETLSPLMQFNEQGIEQFRTFLREMRAGTRLDLPQGFTNDPALTRILSRDLQIARRSFATTFEMVEYLYPIIDQLRLLGKYYEVGLWTWLSAYYFDIVCPIEKGMRRVGEEARHIPPANRSDRDTVRHLIAAPMRLYDTHGPQYTKAPMSLSPDKTSLVFNLIIGSQEMAMNPGILKAVTLLYWDQKDQRIKSGSSSRNQPGSIFRFVSLMNQFNRTFDLFAMTGEQIVQLLPKYEFSRWLPAQHRIRSDSRI